jgi:peroxiredoxin (alkyl hydroperoxide reductase subunit C)
MHEFKRISRTDQKFSIVGRPVPHFEASSNHGIINSTDYKGKWILIFSHPEDFSPVWASEIEKNVRSHSKLKELNCELIGIAVENNHSPIMWPKSVQEQFEEKIWFPVIFDSHLEIARKLGMVNQEHGAAGLTRSIYIIDEHQILRTIIFYDQDAPNTMEEVVRLVKFLQKSSACGIVTPDSWRPGDEWIMTAPYVKGKHKKEPAEMWYF